MQHMKLSHVYRFLLSLSVGLLLYAFVYSASATQVHAASISSPRPPHPSWSGGGCSGYVTYGSGGASATYSSCISGDFTTVHPDS